jgi:hypothetical protein
MLCYNLFVSLVWLSVTLAVPLALGSFVALGIVASRDDAPLTALFAVLGVVALLWTLLLRLRGQAVRIRAGAWPALCCGDHTPTVNRRKKRKSGEEDQQQLLDDEYELSNVREAVRRIVEKTGKFPSVVGGGWTAFLQRLGPPAPRLFTHRFTGQLSNNRWAAGTTIAQVQTELLKTGRTLPSPPTMHGITLGAWFAYASHGNGSAPGMGKSDTLLSARVLDMKTNKIKPGVKYPEIRKLFDSKEARRYMIVDVELKSEPNIELQKKGIIIDGPASTAEWLAPGAKLRVLFCGAARKYGIGLRWQQPYSDTTHRDPHCCSRYCLYFQVDIFSAIFGWHEPMSNYDGKITLYNANRWMPPILPLELAGALVLGITNYEIILENKTALTGDNLWPLINAFIQMHKRLGGRCEFRTNGGAGSKLFIDISLQRGFKEPFQLLKKLGYERCSLHPGKHIVPTAPLERVTLAQMNGFV